MEQYINKAALVAEIDRELESISNASTNFALGRKMELANILSFLDTLEVKEVDINKEISQFIDTNFEKDTIGHKLSLRRVAKHFFELGLKAQSKDMIEAFRTEYEKGRADVIQATEQWLANSWPKYCGNPNIIDDYKDAIKD